MVVPAGGRLAKKLRYVTPHAEPRRYAVRCVGAAAAAGLVRAAPQAFALAPRGAAALRLTFDDGGGGSSAGGGAGGEGAGAPRPPPLEALVVLESWAEGGARAVEECFRLVVKRELRE